MKRLPLMLIVILMVVVGGIVPRSAGAVPFGATLVEKAGEKWLPLSYTSGTINQMLNNFNDPTNDFYGFRYASENEMHNLFESIGMLDMSVFGWWSAAVQETPGFLEIYGNGPNQQSFIESFYHYQPELGDVIMYLSMDRTLADPQARMNWDDTVHRLGGWQNAGEWSGQHWLVYDVAPIPEPATILFFGVGLAGIVSYRRKALK